MKFKLAGLFILGFITYYALLDLSISWHGMEDYMAATRDTWVETHWAFGAAVYLICCTAFAGLYQSIMREIEGNG